MIPTESIEYCFIFVLLMPCDVRQVFPVGWTFKWRAAFESDFLFAQQTKCERGYINISFLCWWRRWPSHLKAVSGLTETVPGIEGGVAHLSNLLTQGTGSFMLSSFLKIQRRIWAPNWVGICFLGCIFAIQVFFSCGCFVFCFTTSRRKFVFLCFTYSF